MSKPTNLSDSLSSKSGRLINSVVSGWKLINFIAALLAFMLREAIALASNLDDSEALAISGSKITETDKEQTLPYIVRQKKAVGGGFDMAVSSIPGSPDLGDDKLYATRIRFDGMVGDSNIATVITMGDNIVEGDETFTESLGEASGTIAVQDAAITTDHLDPASIINDEPTIAPKFDSVTEARKVFLHQKSPEQGGFYYGRYAQRDTEKLAKRVKEVQGAEHALVLGSGMAAVNALLPLANNGSIVYGANVYYEVESAIKLRGRRYGFDSHRLTATTTEGIERELISLRAKNIKLAWFETPSNPFLQVYDIENLREVFSRLAPDALLVIDNSALPHFQKSLAMGADVELMSLSKYHSQGTCCAGALLTNDKSLHESLREEISVAGAVLAPNAARDILDRMPSLVGRLEQHFASAQFIAERLTKHPAVTNVRYPTLAPPACSEKQMCGRGGGLVSFELVGGDSAGHLIMETVSKFPDPIAKLRIRATFGTATTNLEHYRTFIRQRGEISREQTSEGTIPPGFCRLAVGLESVDLIWQQLKAALD
jgi:cystathionine beta-lyase/cystathionine gamma-synthase